MEPFRALKYASANSSGNDKLILIVQTLNQEICTLTPITQPKRLHHRGTRQGLFRTPLSLESLPAGALSKQVRAARPRQMKYWKRNPPIHEEGKTQDVLILHLPSVAFNPARVFSHGVSHNPFCGGDPPVRLPAQRYLRGSGIYL